MGKFIGIEFKRGSCVTVYLDDDPGEWTCGTCTFVNQGTDSVCGMCGSPRSN